MRQVHRRRREPSEVNVTPLLDVVFIMLIFFIVTASFIKETGIDLARFDAPMTQQSDSTSKNILIAIDANGRLWINNRPVSLDALRPNIERLHAENPTAKVIVVADPESSNGLLVQVIDSARQTGVSDVSLAAGS
jgi:biopolymer transport protein ExbD